eukprot:NODE_186_length_13589_cov_0.385545.p13 type:complete len:120 gc:universal NODE_186_length_13589_cov_0.385545:4099-4458(+)
MIFVNWFHGVIGDLLEMLIVMMTMMAHQFYCTIGEDIQHLLEKTKPITYGEYLVELNDQHIQVFESSCFQLFCIGKKLIKTINIYDVEGIFHFFDEESKLDPRIMIDGPNNFFKIKNIG